MSESARTLWEHEREDRPREPLTPFLKWAGGKRQLLDHLLKHVPPVYGKYIEPFVGGGALFFHLRPKTAVIADQNAELMNCYRMVRDSVGEVIELLKSYPHDKDFYYEIRARQPSELNNVERAARLIYLNKTCYNGLYRVNKKGEFNVPFGSQKNPTIYDEELLREVSEALSHTIIEDGDFEGVLRKHAGPGDFTYLDPPYYPVSEYSDFKRYTKEFFYEEDHVRLAEQFERLAAQGVWVLLTNSNTEFTRRLYQGFPYEIVETKRAINSKADGRQAGRDLIVSATRPPERTHRLQQVKSETYSVLSRFPGTRFMGSKYNVLDFLWESVRDHKFDSVLDAFSGSGCVSYLFKTKGKRVFSNDFLHFSYHIANALIENSSTTLSDDEISWLVRENPKAGTFIQDTFERLYFSQEDNAFLDNVRFNVSQLNDDYKVSLALAALTRACLKKRPRGIFTYVGLDKYLDSRPDLQMSLREHFIRAAKEFNRAVFDNDKQNKAFNLNVFDLELEADLVYLDPPYYSKYSDSDYVRRYHFIEGLVRNWTGVEIQQDTKTKKFKKYETAFDARETTYEGFQRLFEKFRDSIIVISYSSNSLPTKSELAEMLKTYKKSVRVQQIGHQYSFGTQHKGNNIANEVDEYIFMGQ